MKDGSEETVFVGHYVLSSFSGEALVYSVKVSDSQASIFFGSTNVLRRAEGNGGSSIVILDTCPQKSSNDDNNPFHKTLGEEDS